MKVWKAVLFISLVVAAVAAQQNQPSQADSDAAPASQATASSELPGTLVRILSPVANQNLGTTYVDLSYELVNPGVSGGAPNYQVQLDAQDPVSTQDTQYTFTGLKPGQHTVVVQLVDANGTPITGGRSTVTFTVTADASQRPSGAAGANENAAAGTGGPELASTASPLPLLSVIGFGVLLGGVVSALRTRG